MVRISFSITSGRVPDLDRLIKTPRNDEVRLGVVVNGKHKVLVAFEVSIASSLYAIQFTMFEALGGVRLVVLRYKKTYSFDDPYPNTPIVARRTDVLAVTRPREV